PLVGEQPRRRNDVFPPGPALPGLDQPDTGTELEPARSVRQPAADVQLWDTGRAVYIPPVPGIGSTSTRADRGGAPSSRGSGTGERENSIGVGRLLRGVDPRRPDREVPPTRAGPGAAGRARQ